MDVLRWVWAPEPFDTWFGPYPGDEGEAPEVARARLQEYYTSVELILVEDSKIIRRRAERASMPLDEEE